MSLCVTHIKVMANVTLICVKVMANVTLSAQSWDMKHEIFQAKWFWGLCLRNLLCQDSFCWLGWNLWSLQRGTKIDHLKQRSNTGAQNALMTLFFLWYIGKCLMFRQYLHYLFNSFGWCADDKQTVRVPLLPLLFPIRTWWQPSTEVDSSVPTLALISQLSLRPCCPRNNSTKKSCNI